MNIGLSMGKILELHFLTYFHFEAKWALQVAIVGNWMKKSSVNTDNTVTVLGFKLRVSIVGSPVCDNNVSVIEELVTIIFTWV